MVYYSKVPRKSNVGGRMCKPVLILRLIGTSLLLVSYASHAGSLPEEPNIFSHTATDTTVELEWNAVPSIRGKVTYTVQSCIAVDTSECNNFAAQLSTKNRSATVQGLLSATTYHFRIYAIDSGQNDIYGGTYQPVTTCAAGDPTCEGGEPPVGGECNYPTFGGTVGTGANTSFSRPVWATDSYIRFNDEFDPQNSAPTESWIVENMLDPLNQAGNAGIDANGDYCGSNCRPVGKRWSGWYNEHWQQTIGGFITAGATDGGISNVSGLGGASGGVLELGGYRETGVNIDPTRPGAGVWNDNRLHSSWIKTWARDPTDTQNQSTLNIPGKNKWTAPMYLEARVKFSQMVTPGFRFSMWMMPATYDAAGANLATGSEAYDGNFRNGIEIDIFEYEPWKPECRDLLEFSWHNSFATKGKKAKVANGKYHLNGIVEGYNDLAADWHIVGLLWESDKLQWVFNDKVVLEITDSAKIPEIYQYLNVSREMTNGFTSGDSVYDGGGFFLPPEGGLYGYDGSGKLGTYLDTINEDKALVDYIRVYTPQ